MIAAFALAGVLTLGVVRPLMGDAFSPRLAVLRDRYVSAYRRCRGAIAIAWRWLVEPVSIFDNRVMAAALVFTALLMAALLWCAA